MFIIIFCVIFVFFFSEIVFSIDNCKIEYDEIREDKLQVKEFFMKIEIIILKKIKLLKINVNKEYCEIFKIKFKANTIKKIKDDDRNSLIFILKSIDRLKPKIKSFKFDLLIGTKEMVFTIFAIPILSTMLVNYISKRNCIQNNEEFYLKIRPNFININNFSLNFVTSIKTSTYKIIFLFLNEK